MGSNGLFLRNKWTKLLKFLKYRNHFKYLEWIRAKEDYLPFCLQFFLKIELFFHQLINE